MSRRKILQAKDSVSKNLWREDAIKAGLLSGARVGILGLGRIGKLVHKYARTFGAEVSYYDPFIEPHEKSPDFLKTFGESQANFENLISQSSIFSLHLPLTPKTHGLVGTKFLSHLNPHSILVNTARGALIDEQALRKTLDQDHQSLGLSLAALDVFCEEPLPKDSWLRNHSRVISTPHIGAFTEEAEFQSSLEALQIVKAYFEGSNSFPWYGNLPLDTAWYKNAYGI